MRYDPVSLTPKFTTAEANNIGLLPDDLAGKLKNHTMFISEECLYDVRSHWKNLFAVRSGPISDTEVTEWTQSMQWLDKEPISAKRSRLESLGFQFSVNDSEIDF